MTVMCLPNKTDICLFVVSWLAICVVSLWCLSMEAHTFGQKLNYFLFTCLREREDNDMKTKNGDFEKSFSLFMRSGLCMRVTCVVLLCFPLIPARFLLCRHLSTRVKIFSSWCVVVECVDCNDADEDLLLLLAVLQIWQKSLVEKAFWGLYVCAC